MFICICSCGFPRSFLSRHIDWDGQMLIKIFPEENGVYRCTFLLAIPNPKFLKTKKKVTYVLANLTWMDMKLFIVFTWFIVNIYTFYYGSINVLFTGCCPKVLMEMLYIVYTLYCLKIWKIHVFRNTLGCKGCIWLVIVIVFSIL